MSFPENREKIPMESISKSNAFQSGNSCWPRLSYHFNAMFLTNDEKLTHKLKKYSCFYAKFFAIAVEKLVKINAW